MNKKVDYGIFNYQTFETILFAHMHVKGVCRHIHYSKVGFSSLLPKD